MKETDTKVELIKRKIDMTFRQLGKEKGSFQIMTNLSAWLLVGFITIDQYAELRDYVKERRNRKGRG